jgi:hypothetical protein
MFEIPNLSPFCCKLETWLRIAGIPYEVVDTSDPRKGPKGKVPFIEDAGQRIGDSSFIVAVVETWEGIFCPFNRERRPCRCSTFRRLRSKLRQ